MQILLLQDTYIRLTPKDHSIRPVGVAFKGNIVEVEEETYHGVVIDGIDSYYRDFHGWYYWSGKVQVLEPSKIGPLRLDYEEEEAESIEIDELVGPVKPPAESGEAATPWDAGATDSKDSAGPASSGSLDDQGLKNDEIDTMESGEMHTQQPTFEEEAPDLIIEDAVDEAIPTSIDESELDPVPPSTAGEVVSSGIEGEDDALTSEEQEPEMPESPVEGEQSTTLGHLDSSSDEWEEGGDVPADEPQAESSAFESLETTEEGTITDMDDAPTHAVAEENWPQDAAELTEESAEKVPSSTAHPLVEEPGAVSTINFLKYEELDWLQIPKFFWEDLYLDGSEISICWLGNIIARNHPDLRDCIKDYRDFTPSGPGNAEESILPGFTVGLGRQFIKGVAPFAELYFGQVGTSGQINLEALSEGLRWAIHRRCDLLFLDVSLSKRSLSYQDAIQLENLINQAFEKNILIVAPAGDSPSERTKVYYPGSFENVLAVGASTVMENRHPRSAKIYGLDILTPIGETPDLLFSSGLQPMIPVTHLAAAITCGTLALIMQYLLDKNITLKKPQIVELVRKTAKSRGTMYSHGKGIFNPVGIIREIDKL